MAITSANRLFKEASYELLMLPCDLYTHTTPTSTSDSKGVTIQIPCQTRAITWTNIILLNNFQKVLLKVSVEQLKRHFSKFKHAINLEHNLLENEK